MATGCECDLFRRKSQKVSCGEVNGADNRWKINVLFRSHFVTVKLFIIIADILTFLKVALHYIALACWQAHGKAGAGWSADHPEF